MAGQSCLEVSHRTAVRCQPGLQSSEGMAGAGRSTSKWPTHMAGKLMLRAGGSPQFLSTWASPRGCLNVLTAWRLPSQGVQSKRSRQKLQCFYDPASVFSHTQSLQRCSSGHTGQPCSVTKWTTQRLEYLETRITGGHLISQLPHQQGKPTTGWNHSAAARLKRVLNPKPRHIILSVVFLNVTGSPGPTSL